MPSYRQDKPNRTKPWNARAHRVIDGMNYEWSLGYFATREEAWDAERIFNAEVLPRRCPRLGKHQKEAQQISA